MRKNMGVSDRVIAGLCLLFFICLLCEHSFPDYEVVFLAIGVPAVIAAMVVAIRNSIPYRRNKNQAP